MPSRPPKEISRIWDELTTFDAADTDAALVFLLAETSRLIGADDGFWVGAVRMSHGIAGRRDLQHGWRGRAVRFLNPSAVQLQTLPILVKEQDTPQAPPTSIAIAAAAGKFRAVRLRQIVDMRAFRRTRHHRIAYAAFGIEDRMWVSYPVNADAESHFVFDRIGTRRQFTARELAVAAALLRGLRWFHRKTLLNQGLLVAKTPLTPAQRQVLPLLLTDAPEKAIAAKLGQSFHTTHSHVQEIFRRYGVSGRAGLMAIWLKGW